MGTLYDCRKNEEENEERDFKRQRFPVRYWRLAIRGKNEEKMRRMRKNEEENEENEEANRQPPIAKN